MKKTIAKKIFSLILCVLMLSSVVLTSCQDENNTIGQQERATKSIVMAVVSEKEVSAETELAVEEAFNAITQAQFKTKVDLRFYTAETYFNDMIALIDRIVADEEAAAEDKKNNNNKETEAVTEEETLIDQDYNYIVYKYPEIKENQLDILYIDGYDMYRHFVENGLLARLDEDLSTNSKLLNDYILNEYMEAAKFQEATYAIPNNSFSTDYTYLLVNKELADKYQYTENLKTWVSVSDAESFVSDIAKYETDVVPIYGKLEPTNVHHWSYDIKQMGETTTFTLQPSRFSIFGAALTIDASVDANLGCGKTLTSTHTYAKQLLTIQGYKDNNYVQETIEDDKKFAVGFVKGNEYDIAQYRDEYEVIVCEYPRMTGNEVYGSMFGVYEGSKTDVNRNMEIITYLNTRSDLRNILQYGVEGVHYEIDEKTGILSRLNQDYMMDVNKTGNVFMAHAEEGISPEYMQYAVRQNGDAILYPAVSFSVNSTDGVFTEYVQKANDLSTKYQEKIDACKSVAELEAVLQEYQDDADVTLLHRQWNALESEEEQFSPFALYYQWLIDNGYIEE